MASSLTPALVLIGFMGAGKTTAARRLDPAAIDSDELLEQRLGTTIADYFAHHGEAAFRAEEEALVLELLFRAEGGVIALGGGALASDRVRTALRMHTVVWLEVDVAEAWVRAAGRERPLAADAQSFILLHAARAPAYLAAADAILPVGSDIALAEPFLRQLPALGYGVRMLWAPAGQHPVLLGAGLLDSGWWPLPGRRFLVSDGTVAKLYGDRVEPLSGRTLVMGGEQSKTVAHADIVWSELARAGMTRADHVVALGGGVVGDLAGFCAATYQRGVPVVHVPTTLVAQVDSAYGGKTGVDLAEAKNYVGAYHQPAAVLTDLNALATLPAAELASGYAEVVKTALIAGGELWDRVRCGAELDDPEVILGCVRTKLGIVAADERDGGLRQVLNLGHTVAHAIETATGYARYRHGEAVALGLLAALRLSERPELRSEVGALLAVRGLPVELEDVDVDAVLDATARDKKRLGEQPVPFVLVNEPGDVLRGQHIEPAALRAAVTELAAR